MLTPDPTFQGMASERARRQIMREIRRALTRSPLMQPPSGVVQSNVVNGYRNEDGDFQEYWLSGDVVTEDGTDSKEIAPY